jgi:predicted transcriptional regulator
MSKRSFQEIRKAVMKILSDGKEHSYGEIERKVNTNWQSVRLHCQELEFFKAATISKDNKVKITSHGLQLLRESNK